MPIGNSSPELYTLGKGIVSIGEWNGATPPAVLDDVGNAPTFDLEVTEEKLTHKSSRSGLSETDKEVVIETAYTLTFVLDEISVSNLAKLVKGTVTGGNVVKANTNIGKEFAIKFVTDNPIGLNATYEFHKCTLSPNGAFSLIGDTFAELSFTATGLSDVANNPTSKFFTVTFQTTTTTTTTT